MPETSLAQTLRTAMGETAKAAPQAEARQTDGQAESNSDETQSGETPEYVSGIDISAYPEQERPVARRALSEKAKLLEDGYQKKYQEVAGYKRERDDLLKLGLSQEEAARVLREHVSNKSNVSQAVDAKKTAVRMIDQLKDQASDLEQRRGLENLEKIVLELTNIGDIQKKIDQLEKVVGSVQYREIQTRETALNKSIDELEVKYGKDIVGKYREDIIKQGIAYPDASPRRLLNAIADPDELEQALLSNTTKKTERKQEKINAVSSAGSGMTGAKEFVDIKKTPIKSLLRDLMSPKK